MGAVIVGFGELPVGGQRGEPLLEDEGALVGRGARVVGEGSDTDGDVSVFTPPIQPWPGRRWPSALVSSSQDSRWPSNRPD